MYNPFESLEERLESIENMLLELKEQSKPQEDTGPQDQWFSLEDLLNYDPAKRTKATWYTLVSRGEVPYHKNGKRLVFLKSEIDEWLRSGKRKSNAEVESEAGSYLEKK